MRIFNFLKRIFSSEPPKKWNSKNVTFGFLSVSTGVRTPLSEDHKHIFREAVKEWNDKTSLTLTESENPDILVSMRPMSKGQVGWAFFPDKGLGGDIDFDSSERDWIGSLFFCTALHEIGHALGLKHSRHYFTVMYPRINGTTELHEFDIKALEELYEDKP